MTFQGDVTPVATFDALSKDPDAVLVDVRTDAELAYVGFPDLDAIGKKLVTVEWQGFPDGRQNGDFVEQLRSSGIDQNAPLYFICRSGVRSRFAAIAAAMDGFTRTFNVEHGFEGNPNRDGHRGTIEGWKVDSLPWRQQ